LCVESVVFVLAAGRQIRGITLVSATFESTGAAGVVTVTVTLSGHSGVAYCLTVTAVLVTLVDSISSTGVLALSEGHKKRKYQ
jgi:hypothetical protein